MVRTLTRLGYRILEARNGESALRFFERHPGEAALLLTDVVMPGMSGKEWAERAREICPDLKVLYTSGYTSDAIVPRGVLDKGSPLIEQPFTPDRLARRIREILDE